MISDGTGITAEHLASSLMTQFEAIDFIKQTIPYIDSEEKANTVLEEIARCYEETQTLPIIFLTVVDPKIRKIIQQANAKIFDLFYTFLEPLEMELESRSSYTVGKAHGVKNSQSYTSRISAVEFALSHDDGIKIRDYERADIIIVGVSRCGKTPSCLFMALQYGIFAANYPLTEEDLQQYKLPEALVKHKHKIFGLSIDPERLQQIRQERRPNSDYASQAQCRKEISEVETMYRENGIPYLNSTRLSIEEIVTRVMKATGLKRRIE
jgi:regulator of PEP synthase PpsR (kinase-PPPase family)